jgi:hypothetical protein
MERNSEAVVAVSLWEGAITHSVHTLQPLSRLVDPATERGMDGRIEGRTEGGMDVRIEGRTEGWMNG